MHSFDVYLRERLTEIDVIINQLLQKELYKILFQFGLSGDLRFKSSSFLKQKDLQFTIGNTLEIATKVYESMIEKYCIQGSADLAWKYITGAEKVRAVLYTDEIPLLYKYVTEGNSAFNIDAEPLSDNNIVAYLYPGDILSEFLLNGTADIGFLKLTLQMDFDISMKLQSYRLLYEIDDFLWEELDDMKLDDIYWSTPSMNLIQLMNAEEDVFTVQGAVNIETRTSDGSVIGDCFEQIGRSEQYRGFLFETSALCSDYILYT